MNPSPYLQNIEPDFLTLNREISTFSLSHNDSIFVEYIYTNDASQIGEVLKYKVDNINGVPVPVDTITVNGNVLEVSFY